MKPHLKKTWCLGTINAAFLAQMERLLWLSSLPLDAHFPVVCFDERPCFLIGDTVTALSLKAGSVLKEHYEYEKHGSCALLAASNRRPDNGSRKSMTSHAGANTPCFSKSWPRSIQRRRKSASCRTT